jgi:hypothetical protein
MAVDELARAATQLEPTLPQGNVTHKPKNHGHKIGSVFSAEGKSRKLGFG